MKRRKWRTSHRWWTPSAVCSWILFNAATFAEDVKTKIVLASLYGMVEVLSVRYVIAIFVEQAYKSYKERSKEQQQQPIEQPVAEVDSKQGEKSA